MKKMIRSCNFLLGIPVGLFLFLACAPSTVAQPTVIPTMNLITEGVGSWDCYMVADDFRLGPDGKSWELKSQKVNSWAGTTMTIQQLTFDADPLIFNNILLQNNTMANQIYTVTVALPTTFGAPNSIRGSIATSLIGTAAALSSVAPFSIYSAQIDGVTVRTLQDNPFVLTTPNSAVSDVKSYGFEVNNVPVNSSIGIVLRFELTPGDTATILSDFEVSTLIPEPSSFALLLLGGALALRRFRK